MFATEQKIKFSNEIKNKIKTFYKIAFSCIFAFEM